MAATATSSSSSAADSYIGSLISLTSKSEIRYEGILFQINPEESSIGLRNVRSFGTEGRKKDGPQIPPSDKVYEHILFRGTDIKDLQVKSSPPTQLTQPINNDPAIIQSHYSRPVTTSVSFPSAVSGSLTDLSSQSHTSQLGLPGSTNFQGAMPLYQPGGNLGPWGASPAPPIANGVGLAMPMYWQGYYSGPNGLPHLHQQPLLTAPPPLVMPSSMQQPMPYPNFSPHFPSGASNLTEASPYLLPTTSSTPYVLSTSLPASTIAPSLHPVPPRTLASDILRTSTTSKEPNVSLPAAIPSTALPSLVSLTTSTADVNHLVELVPNKSIPSVVGASNAFSTVSVASPLFTSGLPLSPAVLASSQSSRTPHKDMEVVHVPLSPEPSIVTSTKSQPSTLPLPKPASLTTSTPYVNHAIPLVSNKSTPSVGKISVSTTVSPASVAARSQQLVSSSQSAQTPQKDVEVVQPDRDPTKTHHGNRGRARGHVLWGARTVTKFTEDFDFMAMNEKFKKEEVWGHLGKNSNSHRDRSFSDADSQDGENAEASKIEPKQPVYKKDDFFDTISCTALDNESHDGRNRYSEQLKIDTETFGDFLKYPGGRGGRGPWRGGRSHGGGYRGRGYGYGGRDRGRGRGRGRGRSTRVA